MFMTPSALDNFRELSGWDARGDDLSFTLDVNARTIDNAIAAVPVDSTFVYRNTGTRTAYTSMRTSANVPVKAECGSRVQVPR